MSKIDKKKLIKIFLLIISFLWSTQLLSENDTKFVHGIEDLPLFSGMHNSFEDLIIFDTNEGRFATTKIYGMVKYEAVKKFYNNILPNLGWQKIEKFKYKRDNETLTLKYNLREKRVFLVFNIISN